MGAESSLFRTSLILKLFKCLARRAEAIDASGDAAINGHLQENVLVASLVRPFFNAALTCNFNSCGRLSAPIIDRLTMLRVRRSTPGRVHSAPQQNSVDHSAIVRVNSSAPAMDLLT